MRTVPVGLGPGVAELLRAGRRWYRSRPWALDVMVAGVMLIASRPVDSLGHALTVLDCAAVALRRWRTEWVFVASCAVLVLSTVSGHPPRTLAWCPVLVFFTLCTRTTPARAAPYALIVLAVWVRYGLSIGVLSVLPAVGQSVLVIAVTWSLGDQARRLAERNARLAALTEGLRREHAARAARAVVTERVRIARELHDVVAHHMSVISVQAGLARYVLDSDRATAGQAMDVIAEAMQEVMLEMRRMLALLRPVPEPVAEPASGLGGLGALLERVWVGGLEVELRMAGQPVTLPAGPDLCCYRVVQEALANVMKHAAGARAVVEVTYQSRSITVRVADDGGSVRSLMDPDAAEPPSPESAGTGAGLAGMRERARIYGGTLTAGRRAAGGFEVVLELPIGDAREDLET